MSAAPPSILVCDDNIDHLMLIKRELERQAAGCRVVTVSTAGACLDALRGAPFDVVLVDYLLRDMNGLDLLREIKGAFPDLPAIMITGMGNEDVAVQAMKCGASDYVIKSPGSFAVVPFVVARTLERQALLADRNAGSRPDGEAGRLAALGAVALGVAHDVNQLLAAVLGRAQLLRERAAPGQDRDLAVIESAARDAAAIVRRILAFPSGGPNAPARPLAIAEVLAECLEFTRGSRRTGASVDGSAHRVEVEVAPDLEVETDGATLREVLTNLILNALHAMPEGGTLFLRGAAHGGEARIVVQDTGTGMRPETVAGLFSTGQASARPGGHGIGLATSHALVQRLGGRIDVESEPDVGSTFTLTLPLRQGVPRATVPHADPLPAGLRVLVIDDEPRVSALFEEILRPDCQTVLVACSGEEAMSKFEPGRCDVVFCDLALPGMGGLDVAAAVRALDPAVAIVLVTGWGGDTLTGAIDGQVVDFSATKPLDVGQVRAVLAQAAARARSRQGRPRVS